MRLKATLLILLVLLLSLSLAGSVRAECYAYPGAQPTDYDLPYGYNCANTGSGCQQCVDYWSNGNFQPVGSEDISRKAISLVYNARFFTATHLYFLS